MAIDLPKILLLAGVLRAGMIVFGEWQDRHMKVRYTDLDYQVFTDGARLVLKGQSPFGRYSFRYSPLLAYAMLPNVFLHASWGKVLYSSAELVVGQQIYWVLRRRRVRPLPAVACAAAWLFNPFTFAVATRGNCEALVSMMLLAALLCIMARRVVWAALWYGAAVHVRIYPIIYLLPILLVLDRQHYPPPPPAPPSLPPGKPATPGGETTPTPPGSPASSPHADRSSPDAPDGFPEKELQARGEGAELASPPPPPAPAGTRAVRALPPGGGEGWAAPRLRAAAAAAREHLTRDRVLFSAVSGGAFFLLTGTFFAAYGWDFLREAVLYHVTRTDPRHNFSVYFYPIYLGLDRPPTALDRLLAFAPQLAAQASLATRFARDLPFCLFAQTAAFVAFNKVVTAQYFVWYFCLLPLILPSMTLRLRGVGGACALAWLCAQLHWLFWAYLLEFEGRDVARPLWGASLAFFAANVTVLAQIVRHHRFRPLFHRGRLVPL